MNIIIPMAGHGSKFSNAGFKIPKPFIDIDGKTLIQRAVESINIKNAMYILIAQDEHIHKYNLYGIMDLAKVHYKIIHINEYTTGAAATCLYAEKYIYNDDELIITNSDQILSWEPIAFLNYVRNIYEESKYKVIHGCVITISTTDPNYSYISLDDNGLATKLAEKELISNRGLIGLHYWKYGRLFVESANELISRDIRANNEHYISLTYNMLIERKYSIIEYPFDRCGGKQYVVGNPYELYIFMNTLLKNKNNINGMQYIGDRIPYALQ